MMLSHAQNSNITPITSALPSLLQGFPMPLLFKALPAQLCGSVLSAEN